MCPCVHVMFGEITKPTVGWKGSVATVESLRDPQAPGVIHFPWNKTLWIAQNKSPLSSFALVVETKTSAQSPEYESWIKHFIPDQNLYKFW